MAGRFLCLCIDCVVAELVLLNFPGSVFQFAVLNCQYRCNIDWGWGGME